MERRRRVGQRRAFGALGSALVALATVLGSRTAGASPPTAVLRYERAPGAESCPGPDELRAAVAARLGYDPFVASDEHEAIVVRIRPLGSGLEGTFQRVDSSQGAIGKPATIASRTADCTELTSALAVGIAIAADPLSITREPKTVPAPGANSPPCEQSTMAPFGSELVLTGGPGGAPTYTYTFDGTSWTQTAIASPPERFGATMAMRGGSIVFFGGADGGQNLYADTWIFDGASWTQLNTPSAPPARTEASMASLGSVVVLFGGTDVSAYLDDTWVFDGTTWTQVITNGPSARADAAMATLGSQVVLFGGGAFQQDTWMFNGNTWTQVGGTTAPPGNNYASMATVP
jgi:hypothetical protein